MVIAGFFWLLTLISLVLWWGEYFLQLFGCHMGEFGTFGCFEAARYAYTFYIVMNFWVLAYLLFGAAVLGHVPVLLMLFLLFVSWGTILLLVAAFKRIGLLVRPA